MPVAAGLAEALKARAHGGASECTSGGLLAASQLLPARPRTSPAAPSPTPPWRVALIPNVDELRALELVRGSDNYVAGEVLGEPGRL